jgi:phosphocarrier protein
VYVAEVVETIKIVNKLGLHARPAALLVQTASKYRANIEIENDSIKVNGKSIMGVMMLAAAFGSEIKLFANGDDAEEAVAGIRALIESKFDEE